MFRKKVYVNISFISKYIKKKWKSSLAEVKKNISIQDISHYDPTFWKQVDHAKNSFNQQFAPNGYIDINIILHTYFSIVIG